jgi:Ca-activated chloride channel family protein
VAWLKRLLPSGATLLVFLCGATASAQTSGSHIREGNRVYEKGRYDDAEVSYRKALERDPKSTPAQFNLGNAQYKQQRFDEAARSFNNSRETLTTPEEKAASWHNLGNSMYRSNKYAESVEAYRRALRLNPSDDDTRYNLLLARDKLKQQEEQKKNQKDKNDKQNKDQQNKDQQNKDQQNKEQQNKDQQQDQQKNQQQQKNEQAKQDQTRQQQQKNQMPKEEAERILEAMKNNEKDLQKQLRKRQAVRVQVEKDW